MESSLLSLVGMDSIKNLYIHITHPLVYSGPGMKNEAVRLFAGMVISFRRQKGKGWRRDERRLEQQKIKEETFSGITFVSWQTLAFADITGVISCLSFLRALHLVPPGGEEKERNVRTRTRLHSVSSPPRTLLEKGNINWSTQCGWYDAYIYTIVQIL